MNLYCLIAILIMKVKRYHFCILLVFVSIVGSQAQDTFEEISKVPMLTPQAASFAKYVEFPVNLYNGTPEISLPLYTISVGDISHPISLSYHAGGIKVAEEASWVGLGWNLNVGGVISRQIKGKDDFEAIETFYGKVRPTSNIGLFDLNAKNNARYPLCNAYDINGTKISETMSDAAVMELPDGDSAPDIFIYNFGSYSGKFLHVEGNIDISRNNIVFDVSSTSITAKAPDGFIYEFGFLEKSWVGTNPQTVISYYLTKITSPSGSVLNFSYSSMSNVRQMPSFSEDFSISYGLLNSYYTGTLPLRTWNRRYQWSNPVFIAGITWENGSIEFVSSSRQDMDGKKLDQFTIYNKDGSVFNRFLFNYDYFVGTLTRHHEEPGYPQSPDPLNAYPTDYLKKRLKLLSIQQLGGGSPQAESINHYFEYYEGGNLNLPYKSSYAADFWGYYNGRVANTNLVPSGKDVVDGFYHQRVFDFMGADKKPDGGYIKANMLKKVTYPTKGTTTYDYEIHNYMNTSDGIPTYTKIELATIVDAGAGTQEAEFTHNGEFDLEIALYCNCTNNICECNGGSNWGCGSTNIDGTGSNVLYAQLLKKNPSTGLFESPSSEYLWDVNDIMPCGGSNSNGDFYLKINLGPGTYKVVANYPDNKTGSLGSRMAFVRATYTTAVYPTSAVGGGVRVSRITHYDPEKNASLSKEFTYSNGILMHFPRYYWRKPDWQTYVTDTGGSAPPTEPLWVLGSKECLYSSPASAYSSSANGSAVGYGTVTEKMSGINNGRTEYIFENLPDNFEDYGIAAPPEVPQFDSYHAYSPGIGSTPRLTNGFLKEKTFYDANNFKVARTTQTPTIVSARTYWCNIPEHVRSSSTSSPYESTCESMHAVVINYFYPVQMGKVVPGIITETQFENNASVYTITRELQYNEHALLKEEKVTDSDYKIIRTEYKYTKDYNNTGWIADLYAANIVAVPLEKLIKVNDNVVRGTFIKYKSANGLVTPNEFYTIRTDIPKPIVSTAPTASIPVDFELAGTIEYNNHGNVQCKQATDNFKVSYLWGYGNKFPVAEVVNASPDEIYFNSFEEGTTGTTSVSRTGKRGFSGTFTVALPPAGPGSYKLTYWRKSGSAWEYVEDTMTTTPKSIGGAGVVLDDIRVYPVGATINTYTYDPLVGMTSTTDTNGNTMSYEYDPFGRLKLVRDSKGNIVSHYDYHFKN